MNRRFGVMALTGAMLLSGCSVASAPAQDPQPAPEPASSSALPVRPTKPLTLAQEPQSSGFGFSGFLTLLLLAGGGYFAWMRRRTMTEAVKGNADTLTILRRTSVGVRSELVVVKAEGKRLLIGITPTSITTLSVLADEDEDATNALIAGAPEAPPSTPARSVDEEHVAAASSPMPVVATPARASKKKAEEDEASLEGQVRGLAALRRNR